MLECSLLTWQHPILTLPPVSPSLPLPPSLPPLSPGLPAGVCNIVYGTGPKAGETLVKHPSVPIISFTGSTAVGRRIQSVSAPFVKKLSLEVGAQCGES